MALQVAAGGGVRVPIIPIGLSYSKPSGASFRAKVLVDIGRPVEVTEELLDQYQTGDQDLMAEAERRIMRRVERHLSEVMITVPDWCEVLDQWCADRGLSPMPSYHTQVTHGPPRKMERMSRSARSSSTSSTSSTTPPSEVTAPPAPREQPLLAEGDGGGAIRNDAGTSAW